MSPELGAGAVVWLTGLPSSGKSTLAAQLATELKAAGVPVVLLDGDAVRAALVPRPGYEPQARDDFYRSLGNLAVMLESQGLVVLVPATAAARRFRGRVRSQAVRFLEIYVDTPVEECARRDSKGLYQASAQGRVSGLPGAGTPYEVPESPEITASGGQDPSVTARLLQLLSATP